MTEPIGKEERQPFVSKILVVGLLACVSLIAVVIAFAPPDKRQSPRVTCMVNLRNLGAGLSAYADQHDGKYPLADSWCDLLVDAFILKEHFRCPVGEKKSPCDYAMNPHAGPRGSSEVVLLFESKPGWNQSGGPELLTTENHHGKGCNVLFVDGSVRFVTPGELVGLKWQDEDMLPLEVRNARRPRNDEELRYWLENMVWNHGFTTAEIWAATGLTEDEIAMAQKKYGIRPDNRPVRPNNPPSLILPYPGGRHPRIGFLEGAIDPQRETKFSVFTPWDPNSYVVVDVPEAIWSNLGLTYLAHTHIDTIWTKQGIELPKLEWNRPADGSLNIRRTLPNGLKFGVTAVPSREAVRMEMWLENGTTGRLTDLRTQICVMTKMAVGFAAQTNENKVFTDPYVACRSEDGERWIITAWEGCDRPWGNADCPCFHSDPHFPDLDFGQRARLRGWLSFYEGPDIRAELARIEATGWRE
jgi:prepilin-type processing-associated H-X9-DG protein